MATTRCVMAFAARIAGGTALAEIVSDLVVGVMLLSLSLCV